MEAGRSIAAVSDSLFIMSPFIDCIAECQLKF